MKLIIFDLDHTLVDVFWLHDETTNKMFRKYFNKDAWLHEIDHAGRSQPDGLRALALAKGVPEDVFQNTVSEMMQNFYTEFVAGLPDDASSSILPGVVELLEYLEQKGNILVLYTGDSPSVGTGILRAAGLLHFFKYRFFGTEFPSRPDMIKEAIKTVKKDTGRDFVGKEVVVVGDSVRDVESGTAFNATTIAVATGQHTLSRLAEAKPDLFVSSLTEKDKIIEVIQRKP